MSEEACAGFNDVSERKVYEVIAASGLNVPMTDDPPFRSAWRAVQINTDVMELCKRTSVL
ncbi:MAG: hypothetical protein ACRC2R_17445 [Xenococcaceae cyanobacterium]